MKRVNEEKGRISKRVNLFNCVNEAEKSGQFIELLFSDIPNPTGGVCREILIFKIPQIVHAMKHSSASF